MPASPQRMGRRGFTLVELVSVLVIAGLLLAVVGPRFFDVGTFRGQGYSRTVLSALSYARQYAVSSGCQVRFSIDSSGYALTQRAVDCTSGAFSRTVTDPGRGSGFSGPIPDGVSVSPLPTTVVFDAAGSASASKTLDVGGRTVKVVEETGYVYSP